MRPRPILRSILAVCLLAPAVSYSQGLAEHPPLASPEPEIFLIEADPLPAREDRTASSEGLLLRPTPDWDRGGTVQHVVREMRVDDGTGALVFPGWCLGGTSFACGAANRFDPMDDWDANGIAPSRMRVVRIHFQVQGSDPAGPMNWYIWEDNGGHKPDDTRILRGPITVTAQPGLNVIDLEALGQDLVIDPPRRFQVGIRDVVDGTTPRLVMDDGLPYVGGTGDFHASQYSNDQGNCPAWKWNLMAVQGPGGASDIRSPSWMIWLDVDFDPPPPVLAFEDVTDIAGAGSRLAWGDYDGDGWEDLLISGRTLYRNNGNPPDVTFTDVTAASLIPGTAGANGGIFGDYDNDGDLDIYQMNGRCEPCQSSSFGMDRLLRNNGDGTFTDVLLEEYGEDRNAPVPHDVLPTEGAAWGDFNGDSWLDLYAANHVDWDTGECFRDYLWINNGPPDFTFTDVSEKAGLMTDTNLCGRGVAPADFDNDGDLDIFVTNYRLNRDFLWVNDGNDAVDVPRLSNQARTYGVEGTDQLSAQAYGHGIGAGWGDMDQDGDLDLMVGNLAHSGWLCFSDISMLFESSGGPTPSFTDIAGPAGIAYNEVHSDASFADFDNDTHLDIFISHVYDGWRNSLYRSLGTVPATFEDVTHASGIFARSGWGTAWADYDQDGDLDLASRRFYRSNIADSSTNHWLQVELEGTRSNRNAVGARIQIEHAGITQLREVYGARGTASQDSLIQHFGLGDSTTVDVLTVSFPRGCELVLTNVPADQRLLVTEPECLLARFRTSGGKQLACDDADGVEFIDTSEGNPIDWAWDFDGDTTPDVTGDPNPSYTFPGPGEYTVTLQVDDGAEVDTWTAVVEVVDRPADPGVVLFADPGSSSPAAFEWSATLEPAPDCGDYVVTRADDPSGPWTPVSPRGLTDTSFEDPNAPAQPVTYYLVSTRAADDCWSIDPYRP